MDVVVGVYEGAGCADRPKEIPLRGYLRADPAMIEGQEDACHEGRIAPGPGRQIHRLRIAQVDVPADLEGGMGERDLDGVAGARLAQHEARSVQGAIDVCLAYRVVGVDIPSEVIGYENDLLNHGATNGHFPPCEDLQALL